MKSLLCLVLGFFATMGSLRADPPEARTLTIEEALRTARTHHPQLHASRAQTEVARARTGEARAPLLPQITGSASYQRTTSNYAATPGSLPKTVSSSPTPSSSMSWDTSPYYRAGLTASELLYDFGQSTGKWYASKASLRSQEENERNSGVQVAFNLRSAYYVAAAARALVKVAVDTLRNQEAHLRQTQGFVDAGTHPEIDLAQARTDRANAQVQLINAQVGYDTAKALLNQAMGVEGGTGYEVADPPTEPVQGEDDSTDALLPTALKVRPDLSSLAQQIEAQELTTRGLKGGYAPALGVSTGLTDAGADLGNLAWNWQAMLSLNWQIFGGGITAEQVRESRANTALLQALYDAQHQQVRLDLEQARLGVRAAKAALVATHEVTVNAQVRLRLAEGRYQAGVGNAIELGDSQVALTNASVQEVQSVFNLATARARLLQALGQP